MLVGKVHITTFSQQLWRENYGSVLKRTNYGRPTSIKLIPIGSVCLILSNIVESKDSSIKQVLVMYDRRIGWLNYYG